ncbi:MAG: hypothetical protein NT148_01640 [Candidatus Nealsonbacteria bacterium]|nr:hypothetical protein [Candidatus Nealsonbacteria bacterium]
MVLVGWYDAVLEALKSLWHGFLEFLPPLIGAVVVFLIGWIVAVIIGKIVAEVLKKLKFDKLFESKSLREALEKAELKVSTSEFVGAIVKWVLVLVFLSVSADILGLAQFSAFLTSVLDYVPNVVIAALIIVAAVIIAEILEKVVRAGVESAKVGYGGVIGSTVRWSIWIFAIFAVLYQLNVASALIQTVLQGIVGFLVIAGGLAFGLGGKDVAAGILQGVKKKLEK